MTIKHNDTLSESLPYPNTLYLETPATPFTVNNRGRIMVDTGHTIQYDRHVVWAVEVVVADEGSVVNFIKSMVVRIGFQ